MNPRPIITKIEVSEYAWDLKDVGLDATGAIPTYRPGDVMKRSGGALRIYTDVGIVGEFAGWGMVEAALLPSYLHALIGRNALERVRASIAI